MRTYYVQLKSHKTIAHVRADANPEVERQGGYFMWDFKRGGEVVGRFQFDDVIGWWYDSVNGE